MTDKDICVECGHTRAKHAGTVGCNATEVDRLGFVKEMCMCEKFMEEIDQP